MDWTAIFKEILHGGIKTSLMIVGILMPLMIALELIKDAKLLDKAAAFLRPVMRLFTLPPDGAYPMLAGVFFGISYGSGVILSFAENGGLHTRDLQLIGIFLAICHGMIEDPLVFAALGANWWIIVAVRFGLGIVAMLLLSRIIKARPADASEQTTT